MRSLEQHLATHQQRVALIAAGVAAVSGEFDIPATHYHHVCDLTAAIIERDADLPRTVYEHTIAGRDDLVRDAIHSALEALRRDDEDLFARAPLPSELAAILDAAGMGASINQTRIERTAMLLSHARAMTTDERRREAYKLRKRLGDKAPPPGTQLGSEPEVDVANQRLVDERQDRFPQFGSPAEKRRRRRGHVATPSVKSAKIAGTVQE